MFYSIEYSYLVQKFVADNNIFVFPPDGTGLANVIKHYCVLKGQIVVCVVHQLLNCQTLS